MTWEKKKVDIMFPDGFAPVEDQMVPIDELIRCNPPFTTTIIKKYIRNSLEYQERLIWYPNGVFKRYKEYEAGFDETELPDRQSALNIYGQKILKDRLLEMTPIQQVPYPPKKTPWWKKLFKRNK